MSDKTSPSVSFSPGQRALAMLAGLACHGTFAVAVAVMAVALFTGLTIGRGPFHGAAAWLANGLLLMSFPLFHSWLLGDRGRKWMARMTPGGIGRELGTTTFVFISSLQLLALFLLWSPTGHMIGRVTGPAVWALAAVAAVGWLLLGLSMYQAHFALQTGALGWTSVLRNRRPVWAHGRELAH